MATCRDWLSTLWSASFKGVPFFMDGTSLDGGRRLAVHEFPFRDDPFIEDLGEKASQISVTAYVASDLADVEAAALAAILNSNGPGLLVLPAVGPLLVRVENFSRRDVKNQFGYIGFDVRFFREGASTPLVSAPFLGQMVFAAVDVLAGAMAAGFARDISVAGFADFVVEGTTSAIEDVAASIETIRTTSAITADVAGAARDAIEDLFAAASTSIDRIAGADSSIATSMSVAMRGLASGMDPAEAAASFGGVVADFPVEAPPGAGTGNRVRLALNRAAVARVARLAALSAYAEAQARRVFVSRPEGVTARADAAEFFEAELSLSRDADTTVAIQRVRNALVDYLSKSITTLQPVVSVEAPVNMPSLWWAWRLYADPTRSDEIVARNGLKHPSYVPTTFEALAS